MKKETLVQGLYLAMSRGSVDDVLNFINNGVDLNAKHHGLTALHQACNCYYNLGLAVIKLLVEKGADFNMVDDYLKQTPIFQLIGWHARDAQELDILKIECFNYLFSLNEYGNANNKDLFIEVLRRGRIHYAGLFNSDILNENDIKECIRILELEIRHGLVSFSEWKGLRKYFEQTLDFLNDLLKNVSKD